MMRIYIFTISLILPLSFKADAQLSNLMWATIPVEKHEYFADQMTKKYLNEGKFRTIGQLYISLERKKIVFDALELANPFVDPLDDSARYQFLHEEFKLDKIIKIDSENYAFEGKRASPFDRKVSGTIAMKTNDLFREIIGFTMNEFGVEYQGVMNHYLILTSQIALKVKQKFGSIDFGNYYGALGDNSIKY